MREKLPRGEEGGVPHPTGYILDSGDAFRVFRVSMQRTLKASRGGQMASGRKGTGPLIGVSN